MAAVTAVGSAVAAVAVAMVPGSEDSVAATVEVSVGATVVVSVAATGDADS
ncbi:hypothetical protein I551_8533 [Mycobacterium ulcerans str. Harvey]|uniref:Secreted protein n=1 Tax=Mycobacterium ulcerans str. Harvey TaxID=1299332 RepID=A0ABN0RB36_MYCUL|nr:hypothetical protein I551_8533 [Mycobacterium ulcerans str. Harvey]